MSEAIFESTNSAGGVTASTRYPLLAHLKSENITTVNDGINSKGISYIPPVPQLDSPIVFVRPRTVGIVFDTPGRQVGDGSYVPPPDNRPITGVTIRALTWDWRPVVGNCDLIMYSQNMIESNTGFGLQTFDENGVLMYDSQTPAMGVHTVVKSGDWAYEGQMKRKGYTTWVYSTPWPQGAEGFKSIRNHTYQGDPFGGGSAYYGCYRSLDILTCMITNNDEFPTTITAPPWVMFCRKTVQ